MTPEYKFVELSVVTDETLERAVNEWVGKGWRLDVIHFAMREASHRPAMAFLQFIRAESPRPVPDVDADAETSPPDNVTVLVPPR
jgi:hypothetical protein